MTEKGFMLQMFAEEAEEAEAVEETETIDETEEAEQSGEKTYTETEMNEFADKVVARKLAEWQKKQDREKKKQDEAQKLKEMSEQQKAEYELNELKEELNRLKAKDVQSEMLKAARAILADKNIQAGDDLVSMLISEDADATNAAVNEFADLFKSEVDKAVKDALKGSAPKKGNPSGGLTKEQIMQVKNTAERQKLIKENMDLFQ
ncbi:MAG: DUF4355 domain-containing protein [Bacteroidales bacterium]|nr:DUF4355 domain-containing protein [Bacteroidales bacterium]